MARKVECIEGSTLGSLIVRGFVGGGDPFELHVEAYRENGGCLGTAKFDRQHTVRLVQALLSELGASDIASDLHFLTEED